MIEDPQVILLDAAINHFNEHFVQQFSVSKWTTSLSLWISLAWNIQLFVVRFFLLIFLLRKWSWLALSCSILNGWLILSFLNLFQYYINSVGDGCWYSDHTALIWIKHLLLAITHHSINFRQTHDTYITFFILTRLFLDQLSPFIKLRNGFGIRSVNNFLRSIFKRSDFFPNYLNFEV